MKQRYDIQLSDGSTVFGHCELIEQGDEIKVTILEVYHELPMAPDNNGVPVASTLTCLNAMIPALHQFMWPVQELSAAIWLTVATSANLPSDGNVPKYH